MDKTEPWLGRKTDDFSEAFPSIEAIDFTIDDNPWGWYNVRGHRPLRFTRASATSFIHCPNDRCRRGGFDFGTLLRNYSYGSSTADIDEVFPCGGDEGTPAGRRKGEACMNSFRVKGNHHLQDRRQIMFETASLAENTDLARCPCARS